MGSRCGGAPIAEARHPPGTLLGGRFVVLSEIGSGGMATVYRVQHARLGGRFALKLLDEPHAGLSARMLREGGIQAQIRHPNLVPVMDLIEHEGRIGLVMELIDGPSLEALVRRGRLPLGEALPLFAGVLSGVAAVHAAGISHRDLKPSNILLSGDPPEAQVLDFGIARLLSASPDHTRTRHGAAMGTPGYMAPEQGFDAADATARSDIFSLGVILYELLTGRCPLSRNADLARMEIHDRLVPPLIELLPGCPPHVSDAIARAMSWEPHDRPPTCLAFAAQLFPDRPLLLDQIYRRLPARPERADPRSSQIRLPRLRPPPRPDAVLADLRAARPRPSALDSLPLPWQIAAVVSMTSLLMMIVWMIWQR